MGQDLLLHHVWIKKGVDPDWGRAREAINNLTDGATEALEEYEFSDLDPTQYRALLHEDLDAFIEIWDGQYHRYAYRTNLGPIDCLFTGGLSWGDSPSEFYDAVSRLHESQALDAAGFFQGG